MFSTFKIFNGHGQLSDPFVSLQIGSQSMLKIEKQIHTCDFKDLFSVVKKFEYLFPKDAWYYLNNTFCKKQNSSGLLIAVIGFLFADGDYDFYKNKNDQIINALKVEHQLFIEALYNLTKRESIISGKIIAKATSFKPVKPVCFIETTRLEFSNKEVLSLFNSDNIALAENDGNTLGLESDIIEKITISPLKK